MAEEQRLRQEALLKEYEICQQEATSTANWVWASTTIFLAIWITGAGFVAVNLDEIGENIEWLLAGAAVFAQLVWLQFIRRSFEIRQWLWARQRQIEERMGRQGSFMLKSHVIHAADIRNDQRRYKKLKDNLQPEQQEDLEKFIDRICEQPQSNWFEGCVIGLLGWVPIPIRLLGHAGRVSLYVLSILVAVGWIFLPIVDHFGWVGHES